MKKTWNILEETVTREYVVQEVFLRKTEFGWLFFDLNNRSKKRYFKFKSGAVFDFQLRHPDRKLYEIDYQEYRNRKFSSVEVLANAVLKEVRK